MESAAALKAAKIVELEAQLETLKSSLNDAVAQAEAKQISLDELQEAKEMAEKELVEVKSVLDTLRVDTNDSVATLQKVQEAVCIKAYSIIYAV